MRRRLQTWIAVLAIALQAVDGIAGALGHSHNQPRDPQAPDAHAHAGCSHHHSHWPEKSDEGRTSDSPAPGPDDCSLCRHFSQPVAPATAVVEVAASERVEAAPVFFVERTVSLAPTRVTARGPPLLFA